MDTRKLRYFKTIADEKQVTKAAKKLHMAQPPLSQQLKLLENELNVSLFERHGRYLELTSAGKALYKHACKILQTIDDAVLETKAIESGKLGMLKIGVNKSCFSYMIHPIQTLRQIYPDVQIALREGDTYSLTEQLHQREIELAIVRLPVQLEQISSVSLPSEPYVLAIAKDWPGLTRTKQMSMKDLKDLPLLLLHRISGTGQYEKIVNECKRHGFVPNVVCECPDASLLIALAAAGTGGTIIPKSSLFAFHSDALAMIELTDIEIQADAAMIWSSDRYVSKQAEHFITIVKEGMGEIGRISQTENQ
ncbi:LysR family transcriptional regulator [Geomicrobium sp. JCM 19055]|uniref:LysR family transcriptional regulator n=1 Tax=Geomicrobium sp. JCM 19055 TaxID=1460649 RepID=UPI00045ED64E|nr:LysR family transcriptional regulator [Geomicrobium sp. JCM 19055]GAK00759.1 transcriptional regulator, LysR family [Geomicrobium sp. JCM 19055]